VEYCLLYTAYRLIIDDLKSDMVSVTWGSLMLRPNFDALCIQIET